MHLVYTAVKHSYNFDIHIEYVGFHFVVLSGIHQCYAAITWSRQRRTEAERRLTN